MGHLPFKECALVLRAVGGADANIITSRKLMLREAGQLSENQAQVSLPITQLWIDICPGNTNSLSS